MKKFEKEILQSQIDAEKAVLKQLEQNYQQAIKDIDDKVAALLGRADADTAHVIYQVEYQRQLRTQVQSILEQLQANEFETISEYLTQCYEEGFMGSLYSMQQQGVPLAFPINQEQVVMALQTDSKISEGLYTRLGKDIGELKKNISAEIARGISTSLPYAQIAKNLDRQAQIGMNRAMRITRTEGGRIQNKAAMDTMTKAKAMGADVVKRWSAALDARTRDSHAKIDGEVKEIEEKFSNGLMYPKDPSGKASEVVNCRCKVQEKARWALSANQTKMLGDTSKMTDEQKEAIAKRLGIPVEDLDQYSGQIVPINAKSYDEFKKRYKEIWNYEGSDLQKDANARIAGYKKKSSAKQSSTSQQSGGSLRKTDSLVKFTPSNDIEEAKTFARDVLGLEQATAYSLGINIDVANGINEAIYNIGNTFGSLTESGYLQNVLINTGTSGAYAGYAPGLRSMFMNKACKRKNAIEKMRKDAEEEYVAGAWSTGSPFHSVYHELGHAVQHMVLDNNQAIKSQIDTLYQQTFRDIMGENGSWSLTDAATIKKGCAGAKKIGFSYYGIRNADELVAESVAQYFLSDKPSKLANSVVQILKGG